MIHFFNQKDSSCSPLLTGDVCALRPSVEGQLWTYRSFSRNRPLANEPEIEEFLRDRGFSIVHFEKIPFAEQMRLVAGAKRIVAPHGAGLANLVAATPGTSVVEFLSRNWFNTCYAKFAVQLGCHYRFVESRDKPCFGERRMVAPAISTADLSAALRSMG